MSASTQLGREVRRAAKVDFAHPSNPSPQLRVLKGVHEQYARDLSTALSAFLNQTTKASLTQMQIQCAGDYFADLPSPTVLVILRLQSGERFYLHFHCATALAILELLLGGSLTGVHESARALTEIEWSLLEEVMQAILRPLREAWHPYINSAFEMEAWTSEPALSPVPDPGLSLVKLDFPLVIGDADIHHNGRMNLAIPLAPFEQAVAALQAASAEEEAPSEGDIEARFQRVEDAMVEMEILLEGPTVPFHDLASLSPNQVLEFPCALDHPLRAFLNGEHWAEGRILAKGAKRAFRITAK